MSESSSECDVKKASNRFKLEIVKEDLTKRSKKVQVKGTYLVTMDRNNKPRSIIIVIDENESIKTDEILNFINFGSQISESTILSVVDKYGDTLYYEVSLIDLRKG
jgi:hypothetical protein